MNKKFILALMLTTGMAFAQTGSSGSTTDQPSQQPSTTSPSTSPSTPSTSPSTTDQTNSSTTTTTSTTSTSDQSNSMRGCLKQSGGNWVLASDNGQSINLQGDSSMLKPHDGHQVQVQGTRGSDGSLQVSSVNMISDSCTNNQAAGSGAAAGTSAADQSASSAAAPASTASSASAPASATDQSAGFTFDLGQQQHAGASRQRSGTDH